MKAARSFSLALVIAAACAPAPTQSPGATAPAQPTATTAGATLASDLDAIRARGTVVVTVRVEAPPGGRTAQDPAHFQKRAFEGAVAQLVMQKIFGTTVKVELRSVGDRVGPLERGEVDVALTHGGPRISAELAASRPFAGGTIALAVPAASNVRSPDGLRGATISAVTAAETAAVEAVDRYFKGRSIDVKIQQAQGFRMAADQALSGAAAAFAADSAALAMYEKEQPGAVRVLADLDPRPYVIAVRKASPRLLAEIDRALDALLASGEIAKAAAGAGFPYSAP